jgi:hypothetical protein
MAPLIYNPNSSQVTKQARVFLTPDMFSVTGGAATMVRTAKGVLAWNVAASLSTQFNAGFGLPLNTFNDARINYQLGQLPNAEFTVTSLQPSYIIGGSVPSLLTCGVAQAVFGNGVAALPTVTDLMAVQNVTPTAISANIQSPTFTNPNSGILALRDAEYLAEFAVTTIAGGTFQFFGMLAVLQYNF